MSFGSHWISLDVGFRPFLPFLLFQVSTYALFVEDVLEVLPDTVVVHEAAASRIQRLTKVSFFSCLIPLLKFVIVLHL